VSSFDPNDQLHLPPYPVGPYTVPDPTPNPTSPNLGPMLPMPPITQLPPMRPTLNMPTYPPPGFMGMPPTGPVNPTPKPAAPVPKHPKLTVEIVAKAGRPDRYYVDALPDTIWAEGLDACPYGGVDDTGRLRMQFHNAKDVVYLPRTEPNVWDRLYGVVEFRLRGDAVEEEDLEKKWGPSEYYGTGDKPGYIHD